MLDRDSILGTPDLNGQENPADQVMEKEDFYCIIILRFLKYFTYVVLSAYLLRIFLNHAKTR